MNWKLYGDVVFYCCAVASVLFVATYAVLAPWWQRATGRNIMSVMASLSAAMVYFGFAIHFGITPGFYPVRTLLFSLLLVSIVWRIVLLLRAQLGSRAEAREDKRSKL